MYSEIEYYNNIKTYLLIGVFNENDCSILFQDQKDS